MAIILVEIDPGEILVDRSRFQPDLVEPAVIYEHLLYCCSKFSSLPAISVEIEKDAAFVIRRHWYLSIAKDLKAPRIRAIIENGTDFDAVQKFLRRPSVTQIDWEEEKKRDAESTVEYRWLIFFFERPLTESERHSFDLQIVDFYRSLKMPSWFKIENERIIDLSYPRDGLCAEFQALAPFGDERWYAASRAALEKFHREVAPVISFQGHRIEFD